MESFIKVPVLNQETLKSKMEIINLRFVKGVTPNDLSTTQLVLDDKVLIIDLKFEEVEQMMRKAGCIVQSWG